MKPTFNPTQDELREAMQGGYYPPSSQPVAREIWQRLLSLAMHEHRLPSVIVASVDTWRRLNAETQPEGGYLVRIFQTPWGTIEMHPPADFVTVVDWHSAPTNIAYKYTNANGQTVTVYRDEVDK